MYSDQPRTSKTRASLYYCKQARLQPVADNLVKKDYGATASRSAQKREFAMETINNRSGRNDNGVAH